MAKILKEALSPTAQKIIKTILDDPDVSQSQIGERVGISQSRVSQILSKDKVRSKIEQIQAELFDQGLAQAKDNFIHAINYYQSPVPDGNPGEDKGIKNNVKLAVDYQLREHGFKASQKMLESAGILASPTQSVYIQQVINNNTNVIGDDALAMIRRYMVEDIDVIDVEAEE